MRPTAHEDDLEHSRREVPIDRLELRNPAYLWRRAEDHGTPGNGDAPVKPRHGAHHRAQERRLARSRWSNDADEGSPADLEIYVAQYGRTVIAAGDCVESDDYGSVVSAFGARYHRLIAAMCP